MPDENNIAARQVIRPAGARTKDATNIVGACRARHTKFAGISATLRLGSKRGCNTSLGKFGSKLEAHAPAAGTGANQPYRATKAKRRRRAKGELPVSNL